MRKPQEQAFLAIDYILWAEHRRNHRCWHCCGRLRWTLKPIVSLHFLSLLYFFTVFPPLLPCPLRSGTWPWPAGPCWKAFRWWLELQGVFLPTVAWGKGCIVGISRQPRLPQWPPSNKNNVSARVKGHPTSAVPHWAFTIPALSLSVHLVKRRRELEKHHQEKRLLTLSGICPERLIPFSFSIWPFQHLQNSSKSICTDSWLSLKNTWKLDLKLPKHLPVFALAVGYLKAHSVIYSLKCFKDKKNKWHTCSKWCTRTWDSMQWSATQKAA